MSGESIFDTLNFSFWNECYCQNTRVGSLSLLQGIFPTQDSNWGFLHWRWFFTNWAIRESHSVQFSSVQSLSRAWLFVTPWIAAHQASLSITNSRSSLTLTSVDSVMPFSHLIFCCPLLLLPQSLSASESFPMSQFFAWGGQSTGVSALASFLPKKS